MRELIFSQFALSCSFAGLVENTVNKNQAEQVERKQPGGCACILDKFSRLVATQLKGWAQRFRFRQGVDVGINKFLEVEDLEVRNLL